MLPFFNWLFSPGMFTESFMQNAWWSGTFLAILCGFVGFFTMQRGSGFAAHALPKIGFAGAAGAVLLGINSLWGLGLFSVLGAVGIGAMNKNTRRDVGIALVLAFGLGTGALFLSLNQEYATGAIALLFGQIVGIDTSQVWITAAVSAVSVASILALFRPLLFATVAPVSARARGLSLRWLDIAFLIILGLCTAITVPVTGALLSFSLLVGPAAGASYITKSPGAAIAASVAAAMASMWIGLLLAYDTGWPIGFFVSLCTVVWYALARIRRSQHVKRQRTSAPISQSASPRQSASIPAE